MPAWIFLRRWSGIALLTGVLPLPAFSGTTLSSTSVPTSALGGQQCIVPYAFWVCRILVKASAMPTQPRLAASQLAQQHALPRHRESEDSEGVPIFYFPGNQGIVDETTMFERNGIKGVRLITVDRYSQGGQDRWPHFAVREWPRLIERLADQLLAPGQPFGILAYSQAAPFAAACAIDAKLAPRIRMLLVDPVGPVDRLAYTRHYPWSLRLLFFLSRNYLNSRWVRPLLRAWVLWFTESMRHPKYASLAYAWYVWLHGEVDRDILRRPAVQKALLRTFQGINAWYLLSDLVAAAQPWPELAYDLSEVRIHHGEEDVFIPAAAAMLIRRLTNAQLTIHPGKGHRMIIDDFPKFVIELRDMLLQRPQTAQDLSPAQPSSAMTAFPALPTSILGVAA